MSLINCLLIIISKLLIQSLKKKSERVLPKGHIEPDEKTEETAVREVREEAGIWARIIDKNQFFDMEFTKDDKKIKARIYLMEFLEKRKKFKKTEEIRETEWLTLEEASTKATYKETKELLEYFKTNGTERL